METLQSVMCLKDFESRLHIEDIIVEGPKL